MAPTASIAASRQPEAIHRITAAKTPRISVMRMARLSIALQRGVGQAGNGVGLLGHSSLSLPFPWLSPVPVVMTQPDHVDQPRDSAEDDARQCRSRTDASFLSSHAPDQPADERRRRAEDGDLHQLFGLHQGGKTAGVAFALTVASGSGGMGLLKGILGGYTRFRAAAREADSHAHKAAILSVGLLSDKERNPRVRIGI